MQADIKNWDSGEKSRPRIKIYHDCHEEDLQQMQSLSTVLKIHLHSLMILFDMQALFGAKKRIIIGCIFFERFSS